MKYILLSVAVMLISSVSNAFVYTRTQSLQFASQLKGFADAQNENIGSRIGLAKYMEIKIDLTSRFCDETAFRQLYPSGSIPDGWYDDLEESPEMQQWSNENNCTNSQTRPQQYESEDDCKAAAPFVSQYCNVSAAREYLGVDDQGGCSSCPIATSVNYGDDTLNYCKFFGLCSTDHVGNFFSPMCTFDGASTKEFYGPYCAPDQSVVTGNLPLQWMSVCDNSTTQRPFSENGWAAATCDTDSFVTGDNWGDGEDEGICDTPGPLGSDLWDGTFLSTTILHIQAIFDYIFSYNRLERFVQCIQSN